MPEDRVAKNLLLGNTCLNCNFYYISGKCSRNSAEYTCEKWKHMTRSATILKDAAAFLKQEIQQKAEIRARKEKYAQIEKDEHMKKAAELFGMDITQWMKM